MRVAFLSPALPWSFGPYSQQLGLVAAGLARSAARHRVIWISMYSAMRNATYTELELRQGLEEVSPGGGGNPLEGVDVTYVGTGAAMCGGSGWYTGTLNVLLREHRADAMISLMDHHRIFVDTPISVPAYAWWPDHYAGGPDAGHRHVFTAYAGAAALSPSSAAQARRALPYKRVAFIPHIVARGRGLRSRAETRRAHGVPEASFVAFFSFANYDQHGRKSVDTAFAAFAALAKQAPDARLFVHSVGAEDVFYAGSAAARTDAVNIRAMADAAGVPRASLQLHTARVAYDAVLEMAGHPAARTRSNPLSNPWTRRGRLTSGTPQVTRRPQLLPSVRVPSCADRSPWPTCCSSRRRPRASVRACA